MNDKSSSPRKSVNWGGRALNILLALSLVAALLLSAASAPLSVAHAQPLLLQMAAEQPDATLAVIVQKAAKDDSVEQLVAALGGHVTKDLRIINAFAAEMKAKDVLQLAQATGVRWVSLDAPIASSQTGATVVFTSWATGLGTTGGSFTNVAMMVDSALGPNDTFGSGSNVKGSFAGFDAEVTPGHAISKVEVVLRAYVPVKLGAAQDPVLTVFVAGKSGKSIVLNHHAFDTYIGAAKAGTVYVDVTSSRAWQWADFDSGLEVVIGQSKFKSNQFIYYDAIGLRVTSTPGVDTTDGAVFPSLPKEAIDASRLLNAYNAAVRAPEVWSEAPAYLQGQDVTVAVVDSGTVKNKDLGGRVLKNINFNVSYHSSADRYGHGTFVATIIGGDGKHSNGQYIGIAPKVNLLNVRVSDDQGMASESDVVSALQWIHEHKAKYNIRVVNLSLSSSVAQSYHTSPLDAAVEVLWFNGIVVVVSAGNNGTATLYPPANDPFVITVGAADDNGTATLADDSVASFSAYGVTESGFAKPDLVAPGKNIVAFLADNKRLTIGEQHSGNRVSDHYFRMSGTSMSAPMVSGAAALLLQDEPNLNPDQVKYRLTATANRNWPDYTSAQAGSGYLDIYAAVHGDTTATANTGISVSNLLTTGPDGVLSPSVSWSSVSWSSVSWSSVSWSSVSWSSVSWSSDYWEP